jgi:hypothetical protein
MSSIRSPPINNEPNSSSRVASMIPKSFSRFSTPDVGDSISKNTTRASEYIFNALTPNSPAAALSSTADPENDSGGDDSPSFVNYFIRFILVIVLLIFAGFNIFTQMGIITDDAIQFIEPVLRPIKNVLGMVAEQTVKTTAEGTKTSIDIVSGATKSGVNVIEDQLVGSGIRSTGSGDAKQERARANALTMKTGVDAPISQPEADDASSVTQKGNVSGKSGYCLVGEDRGIRSCVKVGEGDTCMSGNIFPSKDVCINPSLRV